MGFDDIPGATLDWVDRMHGVVDEVAGTVASAHGSRLACRRGCSGCCVDGLSVFTIEAAAIVRRYPEVVSEAPNEDGGCAFLDRAGGCRIYEARPYVCRTQGLPLRWLEHDATEPYEARDVCHLNLVGDGPPLEALPAEACFTLGPFEERLDAMQRTVDGGEGRRITLRSLFTLLALVVTFLPGRASADEPPRASEVARLEAQILTTPNVPYDFSRLGHVVLRTRIVLTNRSDSAVSLGPNALAVHFRARGSLATYPCESSSTEGERWPPILDRGASFTFDRTVSCDTTLVGAHTLEARWVPDDAPFASQPFVIDQGAFVPTVIPSRPDLLAGLAGTTNVRPTRDKGRVRLVLGLVNRTGESVSLPNLVVSIALRQRGASVTCDDQRRVELDGSLRPGQLHVVWLPLQCTLEHEGIWEAAVTTGEPGKAAVRLPTFAIRVVTTELLPYR